MSFAFLPLYTGDYLRDTRHLTPLKHGVYLLLLFHCWDHQGPLPLDEQECAGIANCRSADEVEALRYVLDRFFVRMDDGWYNSRLQREVERANAISIKRKSAGAKGYQAKAKHLLSKSQANASTLTPTPTPTTTRSKTLSANTDGVFAEFWNLYPRKTAKQAALRAWKKVKPEEVVAVMAGVEKHTTTDQWRRGVIPHPATFLNGRRWEDEVELLLSAANLGQCMWNQNADKPQEKRCEEPGVEERDRLVYCERHRHLHLARVR